MFSYKENCGMLKNMYVSILGRYRLNKNQICMRFQYKEKCWEIKHEFLFKKQNNCKSITLRLPLCL